MLRLLALLAITLLSTACGKTDLPQTATVATSAAQIPAKLILVSGITGRQGGAVARALLEQGYRVRGLSRNPQSDAARKMHSLGVDVRKGDFSDIASLDRAMQGVYGAFSVQNFWEHGYEAEVEQGKNFADAAKRAGVAHFIYSSVANADQSTGVPHFDSKYEVERYIQKLDIPFTIFRPVAFMENWEYARADIIAGKLRTPFSITTRLQQISVRDIGRFVALAFNEPKNWLGRSLDIAGEEYRLKEVVHLFSTITGSPLEYVQIPWDEYEKSEGVEMTIMDKWIENVGYSANLNLLRAQLPDMLTLEDYLYEAGWR